MDIEDCTIIFIGDELKRLTLNSIYRTLFFKSSHYFFDSFSGDQESLQRSVVFHHFETVESANKFISEADEKLPQLFLFTPLVGCFGSARKATFWTGSTIPEVSSKVKFNTRPTTNAAVMTSAETPPIFCKFFIFVLL